MLPHRDQQPQACLEFVCVFKQHQQCSRLILTSMAHKRAAGVLAMRQVESPVQVTPALCGMAVTDFAKQLQRRLRQACPSALVVDSFMGPQDLACIYARTRLNFHPCLYDAYGEPPPAGCAALGKGNVPSTMLDKIAVQSSHNAELVRHTVGRFGGIRGMLADCRSALMAVFVSFDRCSVASGRRAAACVPEATTLQLECVYPRHCKWLRTPHSTG